jgi:hypothetical protein
MHRILIGLGIAAVALTAGVQASQAQTNFPFGSRPYCWSGDRSNGGMPECSYYTFEQCLASLHGGPDHCFANPSYAWSRGGGVPQRKVKQQKRSY